LELNEKFCPICKNKIERRAVVCIYCGTSLEKPQLDSQETTINPSPLEKFSAKITDSPIDCSLIPDDGIAIYAAGVSKPAYLRFDKDLIFGRKGKESAEDALLDLSEWGGYQAGISRRHAMIRKREDGYEIIDLASTNGSWLNNERLAPNEPVPLASGSQLRFGHMRLLVVFSLVSKGKRTG